MLAYYQQQIFMTVMYPNFLFTQPEYFTKQMSLATNSQPIQVETKQNEKSKEHKDSKIKTSLCNKWSQNEQCPYGNKCRFAHGIQELRCNVDAKSYRKKECISYFKKGYCSYGYLCNFSHSSISSNDIPPQPTKQPKGYTQIFSELRAQGKSRISFDIDMGTGVMKGNAEDMDLKSMGSTEGCDDNQQEAMEGKYGEFFELFLFNMLRNEIQEQADADGQQEVDQKLGN